MNNTDQFLQKDHIDYRFVRSVQELLDQGIAHTQGEIAQELGVKTAKFSETQNGYLRDEVNGFLGAHPYYPPVPKGKERIPIIPIPLRTKKKLCNNASRM